MHALLVVELTIAVLLSFALLAYVMVYIISSIHEYGHYFYRRRFGVSTHVFIGRGRIRLNIGDWWFGVSPTRFCNYPGSLMTLKADPRFIPVILGGVRFGVAVGFLLVPFFTWLWIVNQPILAGLVCTLSAGLVFSNIPNLMPTHRVLVNGKARSRKGIPSLDDSIVELSDGAWAAAWKKLSKDPSQVDEYLNKLQFANIRSNAEMKFLIQERAARGRRNGLYHLPKQLD